MDNSTKIPFYEDMQVSLNSLEGKNISVSYGIFKRFEDLLIEHLDDGLQLEVKLSNCGCANLDCHVCKAKWEWDKWIPFEPMNMYYYPKTTEGQGVTHIYDIREAITEDKKEQAVELLKGLGYTITQGCGWKPPLGNSPIKSRDNITEYLLKVFEENRRAGEILPHINFLEGMSYDILEMLDKGLSSNDLRQVARSSKSE